MPLSYQLVKKLRQTIRSILAREQTAICFVVKQPINALQYVVFRFYGSKKPQTLSVLFDRNRISSRSQLHSRFVLSNNRKPACGFALFHCVVEPFHWLFLIIEKTDPSVTTCSFISLTYRTLSTFKPKQTTWRFHHQIGFFHRTSSAFHHAQ